jgi:hypothetical protein
MGRSASHPCFRATATARSRGRRRRAARSPQEFFAASAAKNRAVIGGLLALLLLLLIGLTSTCSVAESWTRAVGH